MAKQYNRLLDDACAALDKAGVQIKKLKAERKALKKLARELLKYVMHDACASQDYHAGIFDEDEECDCGLSDVELTYRRLVR